MLIVLAISFLNYFLRLRLCLQFFARNFILCFRAFENLYYDYLVIPHDRLAKVSENSLHIQVLTVNTKFIKNKTWLPHIMQISLHHFQHFEWILYLNICLFWNLLCTILAKSLKHSHYCELLEKELPQRKYIIYVHFI